MTNSIIYLDNAATTPVCREAADAFNASNDNFWANPSSLHTLGRAARTHLEVSREVVANEINASRQCVCFTSSGTESSNLAIRGVASIYGKRNKQIVTTTLEHSATRETLRELAQNGFQVTEVAPLKSGHINPTDLAEAVREDTILVSAVCVASESGSTLDISNTVKAIKQKNPSTIVHFDAVQAFCKIPLDVRTGVDLLSLSGHKIHAPKGIGALYVSKNVRLAPIITGGGQENKLRSGTEPVALTAAFAAAIRAKAAVNPELIPYVVNEFRIYGNCVLIPGHTAPHIISLAFPGIPGEVLTRTLSDRGIMVGTGSACSGNKKSYALMSMGLPSNVLDSVIRLSFSRYTTLDEVKIAVEVIKNTVSSFAI